MSSNRASYLSRSSKRLEIKSKFRNEVYQNSTSFENRLVSGGVQNSLSNASNAERFEVSEMRQRPNMDVNNRQSLSVLRSMSNAMLHDNFISQKKMEPSVWFDDKRSSIKDKSIINENIKSYQDSYKRGLEQKLEMGEEDTKPVQISIYSFFDLPPKREMPPKRETTPSH